MTNGRPRMRSHAARTWCWVLAAAALGALAWLDRGGHEGLGLVWRPALLAAGIVAAFVAMPWRDSPRVLVLALGATVVRFGFVRNEVTALPARADATAYAHASTDILIGVLLIAAILRAL